MKKFDFIETLKQGDAFGITYDKVPLLIVKEAGLKKLLNREPAIMKALMTLLKDEREESVVNEKDIAIQEFIKVYLQLKSEHFGRKLAKQTFTKGTKDYSYFSKAIDIIKIHNVSYTTYVKAQIDGLKFLRSSDRKEKSHGFPTPRQLATNEAETRLLVSITKVNEKEVVHLSPKEKAMPLKQNTKFMLLHDKFNKEIELELKEYLYMEACYIARNKQPPENLLSKIESLSK